MGMFDYLTRRILCPNCHRIETIKQRLASRKLSADLISVSDMEKFI